MCPRFVCPGAEHGLLPLVQRAVLSVEAEEVVSKLALVLVGRACRRRRRRKFVYVSQLDANFIAVAGAL
jgi:hypothetical protein